MNLLCENCPINTVCKRHGILKVSRQVELCKGIANTKDGGLKYWNYWEEKYSKNPQLNPDGFESSVVPAKPVSMSSGSLMPPVSIKVVSKIGERLKQIIKREIVAEIPCGECKRQIFELNQMTVDEVKKDHSNIVKKIADRAKQKSPKFWQRLAVTIDRALNIGETERRIGMWLDEAIRDEENENNGLAEG